MTDIHCHILPYCDDGSDSFETSLAMAREAAESGVRRIIATPHSCELNEITNFRSVALEEAFLHLGELIRENGTDIEIYSGAELFYTDTLPQLVKHRIPLTLAGSDYLLCEFAFDAQPDYIYDGLVSLARAGVMPVLAHPERYFCVQHDPELCGDWFSEGFLIQLNKGSILGSFGIAAMRCADRILKNGWAHTVASDAHGALRRTPDMTELYNLLKTKYSRRYAEILLKANPDRIINNQPPVPTDGE